MVESVNKPERITGLVYHDLYLGEKALAEMENVGFDFIKSGLCPSFVEDHTAKGVGLRMADSHTGNHRKDDFTPLETIRSFLSIIGSRSLSSSKRRPLSQRGGYELKVLANSTKLPEQMLVYFDRETQRRTFIEELERLRGNLVAYKTREKLKSLQKDDLIKVMELKNIVLQLRLQDQYVTPRQGGNARRNTIGIITTH
ncbi:hypothetical protein Tco_0882945 [Tanacetum coccineum]